jgi:hypothetical protein
MPSSQLGPLWNFLCQDSARLGLARADIDVGPYQDWDKS